MIQTVDNFQGLAVNNKTPSQIEKLGSIGYACEISNKFNKEVLFSLQDFNKKNHNNFLSFFLDEENKKLKNSEDELIISISKESENIYKAQTGNYVGVFHVDKLKVEINSRFSKIFLKRMLNFANDIYLDDIDITGDNTDKELDIAKYIIYYMFVQNLEKAFLLGLPKAYKTIKYHDIKLKGNIDINRFIKKDIPFIGKISSVSREQREIPEIIDVLYKAIKIIEPKFNTKNISHVKTHLKQYKSNLYVSTQMIQKAINSKALQNPIFSPYKKVLKYAKYIIDSNSWDQKNHGKEQTYGFLINVAELFEIYVTKLLQKEFPGWSIMSPEIPLYKSQFFVRKIIPDIVMIKDNKILVFDTKYKRMKFRGTKEGIWDVDRNDFFQINTYMSYYQNSGYKVIAGGLLYPMEGIFNINEAHSSNLFGNDKVKFIVDGIDLLGINDESKITDIKIREDAFVKRIRTLNGGGELNEPK